VAASSKVVASSGWCFRGICGFFGGSLRQIHYRLFFVIEPVQSLCSLKVKSPSESTWVAKSIRTFQTVIDVTN
jgi:hypothetical protein